ncbi:hypothetical protein BV22DRAFT_976720, partial [Leucogyrophana mollusca]
MVPHLSWFEPGTYKPLSPPRPVSFGDESTVSAIRTGTVVLRTSLGNKDFDIALSNVLLIPSFTIALVSVHKLSRAGLSTIFQANSDVCEIRKHKSCILTALHKRGLYHAKATPKVSPESALATVDGITHLTRTPEFCEPCVLGKLRKLPFKLTGGNRAKRPIQVVHTDVGGPVTPSSREGFPY